MSTLVGYGSSEEEDEDDKDPQNLGNSNPIASHTSPEEPEYDLRTKAYATAPNIKTKTKDEVDTDAKAVNGDEALTNTLIGPQTQSPQHSDEQTFMTNPVSPFSANRLAIRNLTLPPIPDLNIPPSPPGSPPAVMVQKFDHFMQLKRQGLHFNEKLAGSSALKNPSLLQKLMTSAGLGDTEQYANTLPQHLLDPSAFPEWAYQEELAKSQKRLATMREAECQGMQRESVEFVPAADFEGHAAKNGPLSTFQSTGSRSDLSDRAMAGS
ncbi:MAG: hypothetical protein Q9183_005306, partial [Haloplaca sp. 2 TL-2023]